MAAQKIVMPEHARLEAAMRSLKSEAEYRKPPKDLDSPFKELIPDLAEKYQYLAIPEPAVPARGVTKEQLAEIMKRGDALYDSMRELREVGTLAHFADEPLSEEDSWFARDHKPTFGELMRWVQRLVAVASRVEAQLTAAGSDERKTDFKTLEIARTAVGDFHRLTMASPSRSTKDTVGGQFIAFLTAIFSAFGIKRSVEHYAKLAIAAWRIENPNAP